MLLAEAGRASATPLCVLSFHVVASSRKWRLESSGFPVQLEGDVMWLLEKSVLSKRTAGKLLVLHCTPRHSCLEHGYFQRVFPSLFALQEVDKCLADGADEFLQLMSLCALVMQQLTQNI